MKIIFYLFTILLLFACNSEKEKNKTDVNFFYWKSSIDNVTLKNLNNKCTGTKYIHIFDVVEDYVFGAKPNYVTSFYEAIDSLKDYVPVIYIDYNIFFKLDNEQVKYIAKNFISSVNRNINIGQENYYYNRKKNLEPYTEILIDCDWTELSRDKFFLFMEMLKKSNPDLTISVTLRLHQLADVDIMGVPPADKGVLMYYNMGDIKNIETKNSILDNKIGEAYFKRIDKNYPLKLDLALPTYSWTAVFSKKQFKGLIHNITADNIGNYKSFQKEKDNWYRVVTSTYLFETDFYKDDMLRLEKVSIEDLEVAKQLFLNKFDYQPKIILFSYDSSDKKFLDKNNINTIFSF